MKDIIIIREECLDSTNSYAAKKVRTLKPPFIIRADFQKSGRGQGSNIWESEVGKNLLLSIVIEPFDLDAAKNFFLSKITALAIIKLVKEYQPESYIKWPNDIISNRKKIAGILIENTISGNEVIRSIIGVGLNVNQTEFGNLAENATSLRLCTSIEAEVDHILSLFLQYFQIYNKMLDDHLFDDIDDQYFSQLQYFQEWAGYRIKDKICKLKLVDVMDDGYMIAETEDGSYKKFGFGEIQSI